MRRGLMMIGQVIAFFVTMWVILISMRKNLMHMKGEGWWVAREGEGYTCMGVNKCLNMQATTDWIAKTVHGDIKANPNITIERSST